MSYYKYYKEIQEKYRKEGLDKNSFKLRSIDDIKKIHNIDVTKCKGYSSLDTEQTTQFNSLITNYINGWGLASRDEQKPIKVIKEESRYKVWFTKTLFRYLYMNGTVG